LGGRPELGNFLQGVLHRRTGPAGRAGRKVGPKKAGCKNPPAGPPGPSGAPFERGGGTRGRRGRGLHMHGGRGRSGPLPTGRGRGGGQQNGRAGRRRGTKKKTLPAFVGAGRQNAFRVGCYFGTLSKIATRVPRDGCVWSVGGRYTIKSHGLFSGHRVVFFRTGYFPRRAAERIARGSGNRASGRRDASRRGGGRAHHGRGMSVGGSRQEFLMWCSPRGTLFPKGAQFITGI